MPEITDPEHRVAIFKFEALIKMRQYVTAGVFLTVCSVPLVFGAITGGPGAAVGNFLPSYGLMGAVVGYPLALLVGAVWLARIRIQIGAARERVLELSNRSAKT